jgi:hypothetical protein
MRYGISCSGRFERAQDYQIAVWERAEFLAEPLAAVSKPPAKDQDGDGSGDGPPKWQKKVSEKTYRAKRHPEDFSLHNYSLPLFKQDNANVWQFPANCDRTRDRTW